MSLVRNIEGLTGSFRINQSKKQKQKIEPNKMAKIKEENK